MREPEPFYLPLDGPDGGRFHATAATTGPWFADVQHAGPPSALLVRALERHPGLEPAGSPLARVTVEVLGPVPAGEVEVSAGVLRPGRSVELVGAEMRAGGRTVLQARGWRFATGDTGAQAVGAAAALPGPEQAVVHAGLPEGWLPGYLDALEWRWLAGGLAESGPGTVWGRQRVPLVAGEQPSPLQRLAAVADSANGIAAPLDLRKWLFLNTDLTLHLHRPPVGEWIGVDAATVIGPGGTGTVSALLFDTDGHTGRSTQALTIRPR